MGVDLFVVLAWTFVVVAASPDNEDLAPLFALSLLGGPFVYLTFLKRSSIRTVGYWVTGLRIVNATTIIKIAPQTIKILLSTSLPLLC